ncbi:MAG TPA: MFS transporter [Usitatibacteraceae bacterium]|nr:MFS transporter [Usitatibacteraceae bacterium]
MDAAMPVRIPAWRLAAYGAAAVPLAMAMLPIYVHVPKFYADAFGLNLAAIGGLLLAARLFDALQDPLLGYWSDCARTRRFGRLVWVLGGTPLLALGMLGLFQPPAWQGNALAGWFIAMLVLVYLAFSMVQISYQAYGAEMSGDPIERTRITAFREGLGLLGVFVAAALPEMLARSLGMAEGYARFALLFVPLLIAMVGLTLLFAPRPVARTRAATTNAFAAMIKPLGNLRFRKLLLIFVFNGIAASIPATLVLFFIEDVVRRPDWSGYFLIAYFAAGALGMPLWVWLAARIGKGRAWLAGMVVSILAFVWAFLLGAGDALPFLAICILSGLGLGADLALPPSILADVIDDDDALGAGRNEGAYFGLWNLVTKMNLALAAGIALPALAWLGYQSKASNSPEALTHLAVIYALLPCLLKAAAALALATSPFVAPPSARRTPS